MHKTVGVTIFYVALARIIWTISQPKPNGLHPERKAKTWLAESNHWPLYSSLVMPPHQLNSPCRNSAICGYKWGYCDVQDHLRQQVHWFLQTQQYSQN